MSQSTYASFDGNRIKHMEMIQAVVARLAGNSFLIKGWTLTLTGAFLGFAVNRSNSGLAATALLPILVFWALDTYYLRTERLFRALYERVRVHADAVEPFFMAATSDTFVAGVAPDIASWRKTTLRFTLSGFYGLLTLATGLVVLIICRLTSTTRSDTPPERDRRHLRCLSQLALGRPDRAAAVLAPTRNDV